MIRIAGIAAAAGLLAAGATVGAPEESVVRGRNEGTATIAASNVPGNRNLTLFADLGTGVRHTPQQGEVDLGADVGLGGAIGVADIMELSARFTAEDFAGIGPAEAHLRITTPRNDRLRFLGIALSGDLYLTTSLDTISETTEASKPLYSPELFGSAVIDLDWLALQNKVPIKTYLAGGLVDDPQLLYRYNQLSFRGGLEWKGYRHSLFFEGCAALYKEKGHRLNGNIPDLGYEQMYGRLRPGARYRIRDRFSLVGSIGVTVFQKTKQTDPLVPELFSAAVRFEAPLAFRETDTEAIRTMVFVQRQKEQLRNRGATARERDSLGQASFGNQLESLEELGMGTESFDYSREKQELRKRREETRKKMEEIEKLLREIED